MLMDFDGTLYNKDSLLEFTRFHTGTFRFMSGMVYLSPVLILMMLKLIGNENAKKKFISYFFKDEDYERFCRSAAKFSQTRIPKDLNRELMEKLMQHIENGDKIYIVTASFSEWILPWSAQYPIEIISTKPEVANRKLTGDFATKNCSGLEKINRIRREINLENYRNIYVYGNGPGDREMIGLARNINRPGNA